MLLLEYTCTTMQKIILDVDTGIDDALAIILAGKIKQLEILGITTCGGNVEVGLSTLNTLKILELINRADIPVFQGANKPLAGTFNFAYYFHGKGGLANTNLPQPKKQVEKTRASDFIIKTILENPGQIALVATAPLTNIAKAFRKKPKIAKLIKGLYIMGGAVEVPGNETKYAEFNFFNDPLAAKTVLESGVKINLVPLDVTGKTLIPLASLGLIKKIKVGNFIKKAILNWYQFFGLPRGRKFELHDPLTIGAVAGDFLNFKRVRAKVIAKGTKRGMVVRDKAGCLISYADKVEANKFVKYFLNKINE